MADVWTPEPPMPARMTLLERIRASVAYSHNYATAKPDIGETEREHIEGLCAALSEAGDVTAVLIDALETLSDEADNFSVSGVYFHESCFGHEGLHKAYDALDRARGIA